MKCPTCGKELILDYYIPVIGPSIQVPAPCPDCADITPERVDMWRRLEEQVRCAMSGRVFNTINIIKDYDAACEAKKNPHRMPWKYIPRNDVGVADHIVDCDGLDVVFSGAFYRHGDLKSIVAAVNEKWEREKK